MPRSHPSRVSKSIICPKALLSLAFISAFPLFASANFTPAFTAVTSPVSASTFAEDPAHASDLESTLLRVGLSPINLAAAGLSVNDASQTVANTDAFLIEHDGEVAAADATWASANQAFETIKRKIKSGQATPAEVTSLPSLQSARDAAASTRDSLLASAFEVATASLDTGQVTSLSTIQANSTWSLDVHFLVADRAQSEWVTLRNALDEQRIATKYGDAVSAGSLAVISSALGNSDVAAAKVSVDANLSAIQAAWEAAVN